MAARQTQSDGHFSTNKFESFVNIALGFGLILLDQNWPHKLVYYIVRRQGSELLGWVVKSHCWRSRCGKLGRTFFTSSFSESWASSLCRASTALDKSA